VQLFYVCMPSWRTRIDRWPPSCPSVQRLQHDPPSGSKLSATSSSLLYSISKRLTFNLQGVALQAANVILSVLPFPLTIYLTCSHISQSLQHVLESMLCNRLVFVVNEHRPLRSHHTQTGSINASSDSVETGTKEIDGRGWSVGYSTVGGRYGDSRGEVEIELRTTGRWALSSGGGWVS